ncbi:class I SAM-dependent methyltransferase [Herbaspirillum lusitanum]|uniref:Class I SAM-dependent methyltransferase n=1 Tax=Herbaspirillum lusitanum TaxID=213312 RepID=A0ABW9A9A8_9BURK
MNNWNDGYVFDIAYTFGYYPGMNPARLPLAFAYQGLQAPQIKTACELGFGQGLSTNLHAAGSDVQWWGNDFNPAQASFAQELAAASGSGAQMDATAFNEFCSRSDLPDFDFIALHGIWSWVSADNRDIIFDFIQRKLKPGGVLYISYNTQPGWAALMPLRDLLVQHTAQAANDAAGMPTEQRIDAALEFAAALFDTDPVYAQANPHMRDRLKILQQQGRNYLAHEYFNRDWHPESFAQMHQRLSSAGLEFACPAHFADQLDMANLTPAQRQFIQGVADPVMRQSVRDFMVNQQFRRDYWVRGAQRMDGPQRMQALALQAVVLLTDPAQVPLTLQNAASEITLNRQVYEPIMQAMSDHRPHMLAQLADSLAASKLTPVQIVDSVMMLIATGHVAPMAPALAQPQTSAEDLQKTWDRTRALNLHLLQKASRDGDVGHLCSPLSGGGVAADRIQQLFLLARHETGEAVESWPPFVWQHISAQGKKLVRDGQRLESEQENLEELLVQARQFAQGRLQILLALEVV